MCKGIEEEQDRNRSGSLCQRENIPIPCELCGTRACLYCEADGAFLCRKCDRRVHQANFLARRHVRRVLCTACQKLTHRCLVGDSLEVVFPRSLIPEIRPNSEDGGHVGVETEEGSRKATTPFLFL